MTLVRVLRDRTLSLNKGDGITAVSTLHGSGAELELPDDEAKQLEKDGFVERVKSGSPRATIPPDD